MDQSTREPQYQRCLTLKETEGVARLGLMSNQLWKDDPRHLVFMLARYKFVSKMFFGLQKVLEVGCADAFGTRIVRQVVPKVTAVDFDPVFVEDARQRRDPSWDIDCFVHDILQGPVGKGAFEGAYALDVLEHIPSSEEDRFVSHLVQSLTAHGVLLLGTPSIYSQTYASPPSREGHVNCKTAEDLRALLLKYFHHVFIFSMNDEVVHTGFEKMAHYYLAMACGKRE